MEHKHIANEIQSGIRPVDWNTAGAAGYALWRETLKKRNALVFDPVQPVFGYAKVILPQGPGIGAYTAQPAAAPAFATPGTGAAVEAAVITAAANPAVVGAALFAPVQAPVVPVAPVVGVAPVAAGFAAPIGV
jgi:hypothetical protein